MENVKQMLIESIILEEYKDSIDIIVDDIEKFMHVYNEVGQNIMYALTKYRGMRLLNQEPLISFEELTKHYLADNRDKFGECLQKLFLEPICEQTCKRVLNLMTENKWTIHDLWQEHMETPKYRVLRIVQGTNPYI